MGFRVGFRGGVKEMFKRRVEWGLEKGGVGFRGRV